MGLVNGSHHIAVLTEDMDRCVRFYTEVLDGTVIGEDSDEGLRDVMISLGNGFAIHPFAFAAGNDHAAGSPEMFNRGHIDHVAFNVADEAAFDELRRRLVDAGACDGTVTDFGSVRSCWFEDPDGMGAEICIWTGLPPRPYADRRYEPYASVNA